MTEQVLTETRKLMDAVAKYTETRGKCQSAYKHMSVCFDDGCIYCNMVRAYLNLTNQNKNEDTEGD